MKREGEGEERRLSQRLHQQPWLERSPPDAGKVPGLLVRVGCVGKILLDGQELALNLRVDERLGQLTLDGENEEIGQMVDVAELRREMGVGFCRGSHQEHLDEGCHSSNVGLAVEFVGAVCEQGGDGARGMQYEQEMGKYIVVDSHPQPDLGRSWRGCCRQFCGCR